MAKSRTAIGIVPAIVASAVLWFAVGDSVCAQTDPIPRGAPRSLAHDLRRVMTVDDRVQRLSVDLHLTANQQREVRVILERRQAQVMEARFAQSVTAVDRLRRMQDADRESVERIKALLSSEQLQLYTPKRPAADH